MGRARLTRVCGRGRGRGGGSQGPTPSAVNEQYTALVGRPFLIPYWTLGFHQCRWGYDALSDVRAVVNNYRAADIPLEAMWIDIEYGPRAHGERRGTQTHTRHVHLHPYLGHVSVG
jgi:alpha-glucosidase (family GH31 glycosyl hydrolase)